jgi:hypothetical protein
VVFAHATMRTAPAAQNPELRGTPRAGFFAGLVEDVSKGAGIISAYLALSGLISECLAFSEYFFRVLEDGCFHTGHQADGHHAHGHHKERSISKPVPHAGLSESHGGRAAGSFDPACGTLQRKRNVSKPAVARKLWRGALQEQTNFQQARLRSEATAWRFAEETECQQSEGGVNNQDGACSSHG